MSRIATSSRTSPGRRGFWGHAWVPLGVLFVLALAVRLAHLLVMRDSPYFLYPIMDSKIHDEWAWALASGQESPWPPPFFRAPLYPYFLALVYSIFGHSPTWARLIQVVLGSASVGLVFHLGRKVFGPRVGWIAGLLGVFYWMFLYFEGELLIVPLIVFLDLVGLVLVLRAVERKTPALYLAAGLLFGLSAIARPNVLLFTLAAAVWLLMAHGPEPVRRSARGVGLFALGVLIPIAPVTTANTLAGDFVLIASQGGVNFYIGNNPQSDAIQAVVPGTRTDWWGGYHDTVLIAEQALGRPLKPSQVSAYWYGRGLDFARSEPGSALRLLVRKLYLFWNHREFGNNRDTYFVQARSPVLGLLSPVGFGLIAPLALVGLALAWRRCPTSRILVLFVIIYMISVVLFFVNARYRMPVVPVLLLFAAYAVVTLAERVRAMDLGQTLGLAIPVLLFALAVNSNLHGLEKTNPAFGHYNLGLTYLNAGDLARAREEFETALRHDPDRRDAKHNLGITLIEAQRYEEAERVLGELVTRHPDDAEAYYALGNARSALGDLDGAARELTYAISLRPYYYEAFHSLGVVRYRQDRLDEAEVLFRKAVGIYPEFAGAYNNLGIVLARRGDLEPARDMFEKALWIDPAHTGARENLAKLPAPHR